jgi:hypothetical protein
VHGTVHGISLTCLGEEEKTSHEVTRDDANKLGYRIFCHNIYCLDSMLTLPRKCVGIFVLNSRSSLFIRARRRLHFTPPGTPQKSKFTPARLAGSLIMLKLVISVIKYFRTFRLMCPLPYDSQMVLAGFFPGIKILLFDDYPLPLFRKIIPPPLGNYPGSRSKVLLCCPPESF